LGHHSEVSVCRTSCASLQECRVATCYNKILNDGVVLTKHCAKCQSEVDCEAPELLIWS